MLVPTVSKGRSIYRAGCNKFGVATQYIFCYDKNKTAELKLCLDIIKVCHEIIQEKFREQVATIKLHATIEDNNKDWRLCRDRTFYVTIELPIWAKNLGIHNTVLKCGPTLESL